ncbi:MAG: acetyl-CoA carboxylase carboxyl transferase subunit beta, partial [Oscillospiraceae bacterium]
MASIEELFKVVKSRFMDDNHSEESADRTVEIPEDLLFKCPRCGSVVYNEEFVRAMKVCPKCNYHARLTWQERLDLTVDKGSFVEMDETLTSKNPIDFPKYEDKVAVCQKLCDTKEAIVT